MDNNSNTISWYIFQEYLKEHEKKLQRFNDLLKENIMTEKQIEGVLPNEFIKFHKYLTNFLRDNRIQVKPKNENPQIEDILKSVRNVEAKMSLYNSNNISR